MSVKHGNIDRVRLDLRDGRLVSDGFEFCYNYAFESLLK